jgi:hypothetical protein
MPPTPTTASSGFTPTTGSSGFTRPRAETMPSGMQNGRPKFDMGNTNGLQAKLGFNNSSGAPVKPANGSNFNAGQMNHNYPRNENIVPSTYMMPPYTNLMNNNNQQANANKPMPARAMNGVRNPLLEGPNFTKLTGMGKGDVNMTFTKDNGRNIKSERLIGNPGKPAMPAGYLPSNLFSKSTLQGFSAAPDPRTVRSMGPGNGPQVNASTGNIRNYG